ncbi:MAG TPA: NAD(P)H-dependent glycerol-3-phosphate dehydrogenase [Oscillospiraceae bacterium]|nr:NAD(P)H-dependent glycerol-3-phosphate dehydrogenase [Oscillospiraceae bacterium]
MAKLTILGSGFGLAIAIMAEKNGHEVTLWSPFKDEVETIRRDGEHKKLLPGVMVSPAIGFTTDESCVNGADIVLFAVPSHAVRETAKKISGLISQNSILVNVGKGLEGGSLKRLSEVIGEECPNNPVVVLTGPSHAEEVARGVPTTIVAACAERSHAEYVQETLLNDRFRIYVSDDVIGCELGGALKNSIALSTGICDGIGYGDNTKAALMTRGLAEITRLGIAMGGKVETFSGLAGVGDLIVTCTSMHSRNRRAGILIGQGIEPEQAVKQIGTVEGYFTSKATYALSIKHNVDMPIAKQINDILYNGKTVEQSLRELMDRPKRHESERVWLESEKNKES